jgi:hypothetical protein
MSSSGLRHRVKPARRHIPEDGILHTHHRENLKSYKRNCYVVELCIVNLLTIISILPLYEFIYISYITLSGV